MVRARSRVDLHVHTLAMSRDSGLHPQVLADRAVAEGLDAICITEHNAIWPAPEARVLSEQAGLPVIRAIEVGTDVGHVLAYGFDSFHREWWEIDRLRRAADGEGAVLVLAHPLRSPGFGRSWDELPSLFEGIEAVNADESSLSAKQVSELARKYGLAATGGSDAHAGAAVGRALTLFDTEIGSDRDLVEAIRAGSCRPWTAVRA